MGDDIGRVLTHSAEIVAVVVVVVMTCGRRVLVLLEVDLVFFIAQTSTVPFSVVPRSQYVAPGMSGATSFPPAFESLTGHALQSKLG